MYLKFQTLPLIPVLPPIPIAKPSPKDTFFWGIAYNPGVPEELLKVDCMGEFKINWMQSPNQSWTFVSLATES